MLFFKEATCANCCFFVTRDLQHPSCSSVLSDCTCRDSSSPTYPVSKWKHRTDNPPPRINLFQSQRKTKDFISWQNKTKEAGKTVAGSTFRDIFPYTYLSDLPDTTYCSNYNCHYLLFISCRECPLGWIYPNENTLDNKTFTSSLMRR